MGVGFRAVQISCLSGKCMIISLYHIRVKLEVFLLCSFAFLNSYRGNSVLLYLGK